MVVRDVEVRAAEPVELAVSARVWPETLFRVAGGVALSGLTLALSLVAAPPLALWPFAFVALVPMLVAQHRILPRRLAGLAMAIGIGGTIAVGGAQQFERSLPPAIVTTAMVVTGALLVLGWADRVLQERSGYRFFPVSVPLLWVGVGVLIGHASLFSTWGYQAYALYRHPLAIQAISVATTDALNLLILAANFVVAGFLIGPGRRRQLRWALGLAASWVGWLVAGALLISSSAPGIGVAAAQMGPRSRAFLPGAPMGSQPQMVEMASMAKAAAAQGAQVVVFHETLLHMVAGPFQAPPVVAQIAQSTRTYIVVGIGQPGRNEAAVISPSGQALGVYGKQHPVAFLGERSIPTPVTVYRTAAGPLATIICYDLDFLDTPRQAALRGARLVAVPSQDWGRIARIHYTHLVFRAVENRLSTVKADGGYDSAIIDPYGRVLGRVITPQGADALLVRRVPLGSGRTLGQRIQPWFSPMALALGLAFFAVALLRRPTHAS